MSVRVASTEAEKDTFRCVPVILSLFGVRARSDGRTGRAAWRVLSREHPVLVWLLVVYCACLVLLAVAPGGAL
ncbi:hypothetical protein [Streptomyces sp. NPDC060054]|uniref:hypothetical protein n=1 Tax=Streptomyces sp. NPDC060054 TaxID=3347048 RepID=UPI00093EA6D7